MQLEGNPLTSSLIIKNFNDYKTELTYSMELESEGFTTKYDPLNQFIAIGCNNGTKILYSIAESTRKIMKEKIVGKVQCSTEDPITNVKWRPMINTKSKVLGVASAGGYFDYFHVPSMKKLFSISQPENSLHCCEFSKSGQHFATAGKDCHIRIYDQNTKSMSTDLGCAEWNYRGHSNRIFSIKFIDDNTIISGGWDSVIHLWDIREGKSVRSFFGPHVAGDSIDFQNNQVLIGCYAAKNQIQIYDYNKFTQKQAITWTSAEDKQKVAYVYSACFSTFSPGTIVAGACGINEVKIFHNENGKHNTSTLIHGLRHGVFSVDASSKSNEFAFTTAHNGFYLHTEQK